MIRVDLRIIVDRNTDADRTIVADQRPAAADSTSAMTPRSAREEVYVG